MTRGLIVALALAAVVVATFLVAVPIVIDRNLSSEAVAERARALLGHPVTVERVDVAFRPGLRIRAEGVVVEGGGSADAVEVALAIAPLLRRRVEPDGLHLRGPRLLLERGPDGGVRARAFHSSRGGGGAGGLPALPEVTARDGELVLVGTDGRPTGAPVLRILRLDLDRFGPDDRASLRLELALDPAEGGRFGVAALALRGTLEHAGQGVALREGRVEASDLLARGLRFPAFAGRFEYAAGRATIAALSLSGYGGTIELTGTLRVGQPARFDGRIAASRLTLSPMIADWRGQPLGTDPGVLDVEGEVALRLARPGVGTGAGELTIVGGELPAGSLFSALLGTIGRLTGQMLSLGAAAAPAPSRLERLSAPWALRDDRLHSDAFQLVTDDYRYDAVGSLGLDQALDLSGQVQLSSRGLQRMLAHGALPLPGAEAVIPSIPLRVSGRLGSPNVAANAAGLPRAAQVTLGGLVRGGAGLVQGATEGGGGLLEGAAKGGKAAVDKVLGR